MNDNERPTVTELEEQIARLQARVAAADTLVKAIQGYQCTPNKGPFANYALDLAIRSYVATKDGEGEQPDDTPKCPVCGLTLLRRRDSGYECSRRHFIAGLNAAVDE